MTLHWRGTLDLAVIPQCLQEDLQLCRRDTGLVVRPPPQGNLARDCRDCCHRYIGCCQTGPASGSDTCADHWQSVHRLRTETYYSKISRSVVITKYMILSTTVFCRAFTDRERDKQCLNCPLPVNTNI